MVNTSRTAADKTLAPSRTARIGVVTSRPRSRSPTSRPRTRVVFSVDPSTTASGCFIDIHGESREDPRDRRVGRHRAEHLGLGTQRGHISQAVATEHDRNGHVEKHLARVMAGPRLAPRRQRPGQSTTQPNPACRLIEQQSARRGDQRIPADREPNLDAATLHLRSAFPAGLLGLSQEKRILEQDRHFRAIQLSVAQPLVNRRACS